MAKQNNCSICAKMISTDKNICKQCLGDQEENDFEKVRNFLYSNTNANINAIVKETGVSSSKVLQYLREGTLNIIG